jgi:muramoyltetrapeptide carboxypeptidase
MVRLPDALGAGDVIHIVAPSSPFDRELFSAGVMAIEKAGLSVQYGDDLFERYRYLAGSDTRRVVELHAALRDPSVRALWTARGGYGATRLLPLIEPETVAGAGKWLIGFSDATALHCLWWRCGWASIYGANVTTLSSWSPVARTELFACLAGGRPPLLHGVGVHGHSPARGRLWGGNLAVLAALAGTGHLPAPGTGVLLLEDVGERPYRLDRTLTQLRQAGALEGVVGVAVGQLTRCDAGGNSDFSALDVVAEVLDPLGTPVVAGLPVGHEPSARAVLLGGEVLLDPVAGTLAPAAM